MDTSRRDFLNKSIAFGLGVVTLKNQFYYIQAEPVYIGVIGTGGRGTGLLRNLLNFENVVVKALCDINPDHLARAQELVVKAGQQKPAGYCEGKHAWQNMLDKESLNAVIIATPWEWHAPMGLYAMERGTYPGIEVPASLTIDHCWQLVETSGKTGIPCMMLENWSFRRDNLAVLNMIRSGLFGEMVHCHCAHSHDCIDHWFFDNETGHQKWPARYLLEYNRDQYPTHSVGPILSWLDINCGDVITEIYSTATASKGITAYFERKFGKDHPNANLNYKQGDIVTSLLKTKNGKTIVINYDMQLPRPYANRWMVQGTMGVYDEEKNSIYLVDKSPDYHLWEPWKPYEEKYLHKWWGKGNEIGGHGGTDFIMLREFINAVRSKSQTPLDVYDSMVISAIIELSGISIQKKKPVSFPDFTKGNWKNRKPYFGI